VKADFHGKWKLYNENNQICDQPVLEAIGRTKNAVRVMVEEYGAVDTRRDMLQR
jgi:hypothetical protein